MDEKKKYVKPEVEVIDFVENDIITASLLNRGIASWTDESEDWE